MPELEEIHLKDIPQCDNLIWVDESKSTKRRVWAICPYCKEGRLIYRWHINNNWATTACSRHRNLPITRWAIEGEFDQKPDVDVDYKEQKLAPVGKKCRGGNPYRTIHILARCPDCKNHRWVLVNGLRNNDLTTLCPSCAAKRHSHPGPTHPSWRGGTQITNGYKELHRYLIPNELLEELEKHIGKRSYYYEHRIVALQQFGPKALAPGMVVRHLDGDKLNNAPANLAYGPQSANIRDHVVDRRDLKDAIRYINILKQELHQHGIVVPSSSIIGAETPAFIPGRKRLPSFSIDTICP